jgi:hypothetical protein
VAVAAALAIAAPSTAQASPPPEHVVFTDGQLDGVILADLTPTYQDLVAGYISETATSIDITWEVVDLPDETAIPELARYFFEFSILDEADLEQWTPGTCDVAVCFSLRASFDRGGRGVGALEANCTRDETNTVTCQPIGWARVTVTADLVANQITASVRKQDLKKSALGQSVAVDGKFLIEEALFQGIAAYTGSSLITSGSTGDQADLDEGFYVLGTNV